MEVMICVGRLKRRWKSWREEAIDALTDEKNKSTGWCMAFPSSGHGDEVIALREWIMNRVEYLELCIANGQIDRM